PNPSHGFECRHGKVAGSSASSSRAYSWSHIGPTGRNPRNRNSSLFQTEGQIPTNHSAILVLKIVVIVVIVVIIGMHGIIAVE
ncbi:MAG: hypothetical protein ACKN81_06425, partial [Pirellulaceae bacterium]